MPLPVPVLVAPQTWSHWLVALALNTVLIGLAQRLPLLTRAGWVHAGILGSLLWGCLGLRGWLAVVLYLALGSLVTRLGFRTKQARGLAEGRDGARGPENVWGSAATGALLAMAAVLVPPSWQPLLLLGFAASFAAKLADTCGSEIGKRWGRHTVLITTLRAVPPGTEGAISLEGTAASLAGSGLMAAVMLALGLGAARSFSTSAVGPAAVNPAAVWLLITLVGLVATLIESLIGASAQQRWAWLSNELVNGIQTAIAALLAMALASLVLAPLVLAAAS